MFLKAIHVWVFQITMGRVGLSHGVLQGLVNGLKNDSGVERYLPAVVCLEDCSKVTIGNVERYVLSV